MGKTLRQLLCAMTTGLYNKVIWSYQMMLKDKNTDFAANTNCNTVTVPGVWPECHCHLSERRLESHTPHMTNRFQEGSTRSCYNGPKLGHSPLNKHLKEKKPLDEIRSPDMQWCTYCLSQSKTVKTALIALSFYRQAIYTYITYIWHKCTSKDRMKYSSFVKKSLKLKKDEMSSESVQ